MRGGYLLRALVPCEPGSDGDFFAGIHSRIEFVDARFLWHYICRIAAMVPVGCVGIFSFGSGWSALTIVLSVAVLVAIYGLPFH